MDSDDPMTRETLPPVKRQLPKTALPWPATIAPEALARAIFQDADRKRDARFAREASEPPAAD